MLKEGTDNYYEGKRSDWSGSLDWTGQAAASVLKVAVSSGPEEGM